MTDKPSYDSQYIPYRGNVMMKAKIYSKSIRNDRLRHSSKLTFMDKCVVLILLLSTTCYFSYFQGYSAIKYISLVLIICLTIYRFKWSIKCENSSKNIWLLPLLYGLVQCWFLNFPDSLFYLLMIFAAFILYNKDISKPMTDCLIMLFIVISVLCSISVFAELLFPNFFYMIIDIVHLQSVSSLIRYYGKNYGVVYGIMGEPSYTSFCIAIGLAFTLARFIFQKKRLVYGCLLIVEYVAILLLGKRSFLLVILCCTFMMYFITALTSGNKKRLYVSIVVFLFLIIVYYFFLEKWIVALLYQDSSVAGSIDLSGREYFWQIAISMFKSKPLFGYGMNAYDRIYGNSRSIRTAFTGAHNSYLQILSEFGIIGSLFYFACIIKLIRLAIRNFYCALHLNLDSILLVQISGIVFMLAVIMAYALSGNPFYQPQEFYTLALLASMSSSIEKRIELTRLDN